MKEQLFANKLFNIKVLMNPLTSIIKDSNTTFLLDWEKVENHRDM